MHKEEEIIKKGTWMTHREDIKIIDCTIRDGGLVNNFNFHNDFVKAVYQSNLEAGVDYMEMGYKASKRIFSPSDSGPWKFTTEEVVREIVGDNKTKMKLSVMADAERTDYHEDILPKKDSVIDMVRVAAYIHQIPAAIDMIKDAHDKGYETCVNLMSVSVVSETELHEALTLLTETEVDGIYLVDSFGALYSEQIRDLVKIYLNYAEAKGKFVGIHAHNNQQLAYANTIEALVLGVSYLDATIGGLGRGAGNCPMELLLGFLKNPNYHIRPILKCYQEQIAPLKEQFDWGYSVPYMITGQYNQHPRLAIDFIKSKEKNCYLSFLDEVINEA